MTGSLPVPAAVAQQQCQAGASRKTAHHPEEPPAFTRQSQQQKGFVPPVQDLPGAPLWDFVLELAKEEVTPKKGLLFSKGKDVRNSVITKGRW